MLTLLLLGILKVVRELPGDCGTETPASDFGAGL